jgi:hypothetical protein
VKQNFSPGNGGSNSKNSTPKFKQTDLAANTQNILTGKNYHGSLLSLSASYIGQGVNTTVKNAVPGDLALVDSCVAPEDLLIMTPEELQVREQEAICEQEAIEKAIQILHRNGTNAYKDALSILPSDSQFWWQDLLDAERMEAIDLGFSEFINENLVPDNQGNLAQMRHCEAIKRQVIGEGIGVSIMENLSRYETHLDRKFERGLAMLIKLKELRGRE